MSLCNKENKMLVCKLMSNIKKCNNYDLNYHFTRCMCVLFHFSNGKQFIIKGIQV